MSLLVLAVVGQVAALRAPMPMLRGAALRVHAVPVMQFATDSDAEIETGPDGEVLIALSSLDSDGRKMIDEALELRNRERILAGQTRYDDVDAMVRARARGSPFYLRRLPQPHLVSVALSPCTDRSIHGIRGTRSRHDCRAV